MFENESTSLLLDLVPQSSWNLLSNIVALTSGCLIDSPISFSYGNFTIKEFDLLSANETLKTQFLDFCYPFDKEEKEKEIEIDRQYWPGAASFIVVDQNGAIKGCAQFLAKKRVPVIPFELSHIIDKSGPEEKDCGVFHDIMPLCGSYAEIYRCRRSFDLKGAEPFTVVYMLFKGLWAKIIQESIQSIYITFNPTIRELQNLYIKRLCFQNSGITVRFGNSPKDWQLLVKDCLFQENKLATKSRSHFFMQTWFRKDLKKKNLRILRRHRPVTAHLVSEIEPVLFTNVVASQKRVSMRRKDT
jgi:hypothetical protein